MPLCLEGSFKIMAGDEGAGGAVATVACFTSFVYKSENIKLHVARLVPFIGNKFKQRIKPRRKKKSGIFFIC